MCCNNLSNYGEQIEISFGHALNDTGREIIKFPCINLNTSEQTHMYVSYLMEVEVDFPTPAASARSLGIYLDAQFGSTSDTESINDIVISNPTTITTERTYRLVGRTNYLSLETSGGYYKVYPVIIYNHSGGECTITIKKMQLDIITF